MNAPVASRPPHLSHLSRLSRLFRLFQLSRRSLRGTPAARQAGPGASGWVGGLRGVHPVEVLRWLRIGVLAMVAATCLLYFLVATQSGDRIATVRHTEGAIDDIRMARQAAELADDALKRDFHSGQVALIGTGTEFANETARVNSYVTAAADGNAAGKPGLTQIQFVQGQLTTCVQLADAAVRDFPRTGEASADDARRALDAPRENDPVTKKPIPDTGGLMMALDDLSDLQRQALDRQLHSRWIDPGYVRVLLVGPATAMLVLVMATEYVVARHFRRHAGRGLTAALLATAAVGGTVDVLTGHDRSHLAAHPWAAHPLTMALSLTLLTAAGALAYLAYRPRLAEYRFPLS